MKYSFFAFWIFLLGMFPVATFADGGFFPAVILDTPAISEPNQTAAILFDEANSREKLVIAATVGGDIPDYAWVIPTPAYPTVSEGDPDLFSDLWDITKPKYIENRLAFPSFSQSLGLSGGITMVHEQFSSGVFDVAILSTTGAGSLLEWLHANGYAVSDNARDVLNSYIEKRWYFVALKVNQLNIPIIKRLHDLDPRIISSKTAEDILTERIVDHVKSVGLSIDPILAFTYVPTEEEKKKNRISYHLVPYTVVESGFVSEMKEKYQLYLQDPVAYVAKQIKTGNGICNLFKAKYCANVGGFEYELRNNSYEFEKNAIAEYFGVNDSGQVRDLFVRRLAQDISSNVPYEQSFVRELAEKKLIKERDGVAARYRFLRERYQPKGDIEMRVRGEVERRLRAYTSEDSFGLSSSAGTRPSPIEMTFATDVPIFPLRISSVNSGQSRLLLYVVSSQYFDAPGFETKFRGEVTSSKGAVASFLGDFVNPKLVRLEATMQTKDMLDDIVFSPSRSQREYREKVYAEPDRFSVGHISLFLLYYFVFPMMGWLLVAIMAEPVIRLRAKYLPTVAPYTFTTKLVYASLLALTSVVGFASFLIQFWFEVAFAIGGPSVLVGVVFISLLPVFLIGFVLVLHELVSIGKRIFFPGNETEVGQK